MHPDPESRALLLFIVLVLRWLALIWFRQQAFSVELLQQSPSLGPSAQTTSGFCTLDVGALDLAAKFVLMT